MNDNNKVLEGQRHAESLSLVNDLAVLLELANQYAKEGRAEDIASGFNFEFWAKECRRIASL